MINKYFNAFTAITVCGSLLLAQMPGFAARREIPGGLATVDCVIHQNGTEVFWSLRVYDSSKPILYYDFEVKLGGGERNETFVGTGNFTSLSKSVFFDGYRKNVSATVKGEARGADGNGIYRYVVPLTSTECLPSYKGRHQ